LKAKKLVRALFMQPSEIPHRAQLES